MKPKERHQVESGEGRTEVRPDAENREYEAPRLEKLGKLNRVINASGKITVGGGRA